MISYITKFIRMQFSNLENKMTEKQIIYINKVRNGIREKELYMTKKRN